MENGSWKNVSKSLTACSFLQVVANTIGACILSIYFMVFDPLRPVHGIKSHLTIILILIVVLIGVGVIRNVGWQKDLKKFVRMRKSGIAPPASLEESAQAKILDLPLFSSWISSHNWLAAALFMAGYQFFAPFGYGGLREQMFQAARVFMGAIIGGVVSCVIVYFSLELVCQKIRPLFFPRGGLVETPASFRPTLGTRMIVTFLLVSILPMMILAVLSYSKARLMMTMEPDQVLESLFYTTVFLLLVEMLTAVTISHLFAKSLLKPLKRIREAMFRVENGQLSKEVLVTANDELGELGEHFNRMLEGLRERYRIRRYLELAMEVQQNLLPVKPPAFDGYDIYGDILYCDETGGDYFDYLSFAKENCFGLAVGDVSDHGIASALLMATGRAFIRQRCAMGGELEKIVSDVNIQFCQDVGDSGRFMTLFLCLAFSRGKTIQWVNAGHDSAIHYDARKDTFSNLTGGGLPLGVMAESSYCCFSRKMLTGDILVVGTDGIWECRNPEGEMFGKENLKCLVRENKAKGAKQISEAILKRIEAFSSTRIAEDDITVVVLKKT